MLKWMPCFSAGDWRVPPGLPGWEGSGSGLLRRPVVGPRHRLGDAQLPRPAGCPAVPVNRTDPPELGKELLDPDQPDSQVFGAKAGTVERPYFELLLLIFPFLMNHHSSFLSIWVKITFFHLVLDLPGNNF